MNSVWAEYSAASIAEHKFKLKRAGQTEGFLGKKVQDHFPTFGRDPQDHDFAEMTLDAIFPRATHPALAKRGLLAGATAGFGGALPGGIDFGAATASLIMPQSHPLSWRAAPAVQSLRVDEMPSLSNNQVHWCGEVRG